MNKIKMMFTALAITAMSFATVGAAFAMSPDEEQDQETAQECIQRVNGEFSAQMQAIAQSGADNATKKQKRTEAIAHHLLDLGICNSL